MKTHQAEYKTALERMERRMAERDAEAAKRETRLLLSIAGMMVLGLTTLGFIFA